MESSGGIPEKCWLDPRVEVRQSSIAGLGLFATAPIRKGEAVGVLGGRVIDDEELRDIARSRPKYNSAAIGEGRSLTFKDAELLARGNHSCDSNLWMRDEFTLEARRDIAAGEEVVIDYALLTAIPEWEMACSCGSTHCRHIVRGNDWTRVDVQERYKDHFSPFLNERIRRRKSQSGNSRS